MSDIAASRYAKLLDGQLCDLDRIANRARANLNDLSCNNFRERIIAIHKA
jgi:hypothetical protein